MKLLIWFQTIIDECLQIIKNCYDILVMESENKRIMDNRLERILNESFV